MRDAVQYLWEGHPECSSDEVVLYLVHQPGVGRHPYYLDLDRERLLGVVPQHPCCFELDRRRLDR